MRRHPILYSALLVMFVGFFFGALVLSLSFLSPPDSRPRFIPGGKVAILKIEGPIYSSTDILKKLHRFEKDASIKAVVIRIDSPGGAVAPSQEIYEQVKKLKGSKSVIVSMGTVAASGGYYIAAAGHKILASQGTITGSIGVIMETFGVQELISTLKLENRVIKSVPYKDVGSPFRQMTPEERKYLQAIVDNMDLQFKKAVAAERKITMEEITNIANGKVYTGEQAMALKLIDGFGTVYDAIAEAKKMAGLPENATVIWPREDRYPFKWLEESDGILRTLWRLWVGMERGSNPSGWEYFREGQFIRFR